MSDSIVAQILVYQNQQNTKEIATYFSHPDPTYRYYSARAFQSFTDLTVLDSLIMLLKDDVIDVANAAAYALGQSRSGSVVTALIESYDNEDSLGQRALMNATILEAIGKTGTEDELNLFTSIKTFLPTDTTLFKGLLRGVLEFQLRGIYNAEADEFIEGVALNSSYPESVRLLAIEIAQRSKTISLNDKFFTIRRLISEAKRNDVKVSYVRLLNKAKGTEANKYLQSLVKQGPELAVKAEALKGLSDYPYSSIQSFLDSLVFHEEVQLRNIALDMLLEKGTEEKSFVYQGFLNKTQDPFAKAKLYRIVIKKLPFYYAVTKRTMRNEIGAKIAAAGNPYLKAELYNALSEDAYNYDLFITALSDKEAIVRTTAALGLLKILQSDELKTQLKSQVKKIEDEIYAGIDKALREKADDGLIYEVIQAAEDIKFSRLTAALSAAKDKLKLPESLEAYQAICEKIGCESELKKSYLKEFSSADIIALEDTVRISISMEFGEMELELYKEYAPFTVLAMLDLIKEGYFDNKFIHRVVSQFVIQDGCPRGDGYGSLDFILRTETPQVYFDKAGLIGMASAGRDTESSQWFITYKNTPHLNGNYTIFGKVTKGLDNVQQAWRGAGVNYIKLK